MTPQGGDVVRDENGTHWMVWQVQTRQTTNTPDGNVEEALLYNRYGMVTVKRTYQLTVIERFGAPVKSE